MVAVWPLQRMVRSRMDLLKSELISYIEEVTGRTIKYGSVSPSILRFLEIRDMRVLANDGREEEQVLLSINRIRIYYNIFRLFGKDPTKAFSRVSIEDSNLIFDTKKDSDLIEFIKELSLGGDIEREIPNLVISGRNLSFTILSDEFSLFIDKVFFDLDTGKEEFQIQVRGTASTDQVEMIKGLDFVRADIDVTGSIARDFADANLRSSVAFFESNLFSLGEQTFQVSVREKTVELRKIQDRLPLDLLLTVDLTNMAIEAQMSAVAFRPKSLLVPGKPLDNIAPLLDSAISGEIGVTYRIEEKRLLYTGSVQLEIPKGILPLSGLADAVFSGTDGQIQFSHLSVITDEGSVSFVGGAQLSSFYPSGTLTFSDVTYGTGRPLAGTIEVLSDKNGMRLHSGNLLYENVALSNIEGIVELFDGGADFSISGQLDGKNGANGILATGNITLDAPPALELGLQVSEVSLGDIYRLSGGTVSNQAISGIIESAYIDVDAFIRTDFNRFAFSVSQFRAWNGEDEVKFLVSGNNTNVNLTDLQVDWAGLELSGNAGITLSTKGNADFVGSVQYRNQTYSLEGNFARRKGITFTGEYGIKGALDFPNRGSDLYNFQLVSRRLPVPLQSEIIWADLNLTGMFKNEKEWRIELLGSSIAPLPIIALEGSQLTLEGTVLPGSADITRLVFADDLSELEGSAKVDIDLANRALTGGSISLAKLPGGERYDANFSIETDNLSATVDFVEAPLKRFFKTTLTGSATGRVDFSGTRENPVFQLAAQTVGAKLNDDHIFLDAELNLTERGLSLKSLDADYLSNRLRTASGYVHFDDGRFAIAGNLFAAVQERPLQARINIDGGFVSPIDYLKPEEAIFEDFGALLRINNILLDGEANDPWNFSFSQENRTISFIGGPENAIEGTLFDDQSFAVVLKDPIPITFSASGKLEPNQIQAELNDVTLDMEGIEKIVQIPFFNITSGTAKGNLTVSGPLNDPDITGLLYGRDLLATLPVVPEVVGPFFAKLDFQGKNLIISEALMPAGASMVDGRVDFTLDHWLPQIFDIQLGTVGDEGLHIRYTFAGIDVDGYAEGDLSITGDPLAIEMKGSFAIQNTTIKIGESQKGKGDSKSNLIVDMSFVTGKKVSFIWPTENFPVLRSFADTGQVLRLKSDPIAGTWSIRGDIEVRGGEIFYVQRNFYLKSGEISFRENQDHFDPRITVRAESRDITDDGEKLRIYLVMYNQPFSNFKPRFESDPPLSRLDILSRLGQDIREEIGGDQFGLSSALYITADILGQFAILRTFEQTVRDILSLDLFSVRTHILQNVLSETVFAGSEGSAENAPSLGRYLDNTTLFLGKYFGNDLFVEAMIRLRTNQALLSNLQTGDDLYVESEIRLEWKTPLFLLELSLLPDILDPLASLTQTSLGLSWGFSF